MKEAEPGSPSIGGAASVTTTNTSAALNVEEHASTPPASDRHRTGFPKQGGQSMSYWLQQVRCDPLLDHRTSETLPKEADTVIIGSGISGTLVTKHHLETWPSKSVVIVEAREFCSGATGRNAGHCKPDQWRHYGKFEKAYGKAQAIKIMNNESATWKALVAYVQENNVDCDLWVGETLDVPLDEDVAKAARDVFERYANAGGKVDHIKVTHDPAKAAKISKIKGATACYAWQASTLQPWKLTAHIMRENLKKGANLQTYTVANSITSDGSGRRKWTVRTDRGAIACDTVVHATNAYSAALEPSLRGLITPKPHMCNRVVPPRALSGSKALCNSYGVLLADGALFSINPRCTADGNILFGGSNPGQRALDEWVEQNPGNCINDGLADLESVTKCVKDFVNEEFDGWREAEFGPGEGFAYSWSGIIGLSVDGVPFVGALPGKEGQWICAGHHGHGMARIFTAAPGLVKLMNGKEWGETGLPDVYQMTPQRLEKLKKVDVDTPKVAII
ncbi:DAO-domain-containing protein [Cucurbitaria berberidis CBS 394.84]|uniref:DAO-domain-containing protein n=1 Tax=Cucurbitaria berberidis CBS 394.84 TaxID=1168544 RepID=A0A9P4GQ17_9PLEO|nr:DAO-domain-containing protein [Cucurbitaria berberidis CBS 394.84]KAF1849692.1 DAO-domain-containing protein [Cucurbitaria berberidis CBS 394.84]